MLGYKQTTKKDLLGVSADGFSERSFLFHSPSHFLEEGISLCSSFSSSWVPGWVFEEVYRLIKLDHYPPGVFNFGREVYKCNFRFNFLKVTSEEYRGLRTTELAEAEGKWCGLPLQSYPGLVPAQFIVPAAPWSVPELSWLHNLVGTVDEQFFDGRHNDYAVHSYPGPG